MSEIQSGIYDADVLRRLRIINFQNLINVEFPDPGSYSFNETDEDGGKYKHKPINGYCVSCEEEGWSDSTSDPEFKLTNISHGAHSSDFFEAVKFKDLDKWHNDPIMFIFETPSLNYEGMYKKTPYQRYNKCPIEDWYWIHNMRKHNQFPGIPTFPEYFKGGKNGYGYFVLSAMFTFQLSNVYVTNLVKCSMNKEKEKDPKNKERFRGIDHFREETIINCYNKFLKKEIEIFDPKIIFAMGSKVENWVKRLGKDYSQNVDNKSYVQQLPHPAGFRKSEHFQATYFWEIVRALHKIGIIDTEKIQNLTKMYLEKCES